MIEVGRSWRCVASLDVTSMSSVKLSLSLSMFAFAQALTSTMHDCMELSSSDSPSGGADIRNYKSPANGSCVIECFDYGRQRLNIHGEKNRAKN